MRKSIIFLTSNFPPAIGGIANFIYEIVKHLPKETTNVIGLPTDDFGNFDSKQSFSVDRIKLPSGFKASLSSVFKFLAPFYFAKLIKYRKADVILCDSAHHPLMFAAWGFRKLFGIPYGVFTHGTDVLRHQGGKNRYFINWLLRSANILFANSKHTANVLVSIGIQPDKIHIIWPTLNTDKFKDTVPLNKILDMHNLSDKKIILSVGRLVERKGVDTFIRAMSIVVKSIPKARYLVVGTGPYEFVLKKLVAEFGLQKYITFAGYVADDDLYAYFKACDIFVMISRELSQKGDIEGFGIVFLEANYFEKAVVAGRSGGIVDAVLHGETGLLVDPDCAQEAAEAAIELLKNPKIAKKFGAAGKDRVLKEFSGASSADKVRAVLQKQKIIESASSC